MSFRSPKPARGRPTRWPLVLTLPTLLLLGPVASADEKPSWIDRDPDRPATWDMSLEELKAIGLGQTRADPIPMPAELTVENPGPVQLKQGTIFINYDGATITQGGENSQQNQSFMWGGQYAAYGNGSKRDAVTQAVVQDWQAFNVIITESRPGSGDYTMNMTGPTNFIGQGVLGVAPVDCNDLNTHNNITYAFHSVNDQFSASTTATTIGQEVAHSYGLEHINQASDIMNPQNAGGDPAFLDACHSITGQIYCPDQHVASCGSQSQQNSYQELMNIFGPSTPDTAPPEVMITYPADGDTFDAGASFNITATATDDQSINELKLYIDGEFIQADGTEPYDWGVSNIPEGQYELHVIASDYAGNEAMSNVVNIGVGMAPTTTSGSGSDSATGGSDSGGTDGSTDGSASGGSGPITGGESDGLPPGFGDDGDDGGCACTSGNVPAPAGLLLLALGVGIRRRRE